MLYDIISSNYCWYTLLLINIISGTYCYMFELMLGKAFRTAGSVNPTQFKEIEYAKETVACVRDLEEVNSNITNDDASSE